MPRFFKKTFFFDDRVKSRKFLFAVIPAEAEHLVMQYGFQRVVLYIPNVESKACPGLRSKNPA